MKKMELTVHKGFYPTAEIRNFIGDICARLDIDKKNTYHIKTAVDEVCTNIVKHTYKHHQGPIKISLDQGKKKITILVRDSGAQFNPLETTRLTPEELIRKRREGGLGVSLVQRLMDEVRYTRRKRYNEFVMVKYYE